MTVTRAGHIDIRESVEGEYRFTSGNAIYVEALIGGRWVGRYWAADGRINFPRKRWGAVTAIGEGWAADAFRLAINGQRVADGWDLVGTPEECPAAAGAQHLAIGLSNGKPSVELKVHTLLDGTPVLTRWLELTNNSDEAVALTDVSPWSGRLWQSGSSFTLGYFARDDGRHEGWLAWTPLPDGRTVVKSDKGQGFDDPFFIVRNDDKGEYFICHLAWSANWQMVFERDEEGLLFSIGPWASFPQRVVSAGETITTPAVHLGHTEGDLDAAVQGMHDHIRRSVLPGRPADRSYLVQVGIPGDTGYLSAWPGDDKTVEFNESNLLKTIDVAAEIGAEMFIVDAWWWDVTLDWVAAPDRFPRGLDPVREYAHEKGMLFGLYGEVEGGRGPVEESSVVKEHPDWLGPFKTLDLTNPEVEAHVEAELVRIIEKYRPDLYREDYNWPFTYEGPTTERDGFTENNYWRYYEAFYGIFERIQERYPDLILQQCCGGGARNDLGTVGRFHETFPHEGESPHTLRVYSGITMALPPEILVLGIGNTSDRGQLDTHLRSMFTLSTPWVLSGIAPSVAELSPSNRERYRHFVDIYKEFIRPVWPTCRIYHHAPVSARGGVESGPWFAVEFGTPDRTRGWATIVRMGASDSDSYGFVARGLDPGRTYRVTFDNVGTSAMIEGWRLTTDGLSIRLESTMSSELLLFEAQ